MIGSDNGLSPERHQAIIWTNAWIMLIGPLGTNFSEILIEIYTFSFKKMHLKMSSGKWWPSCLGLNMLKCFWLMPVRKSGPPQVLKKNQHFIAWSPKYPQKALLECETWSCIFKFKVCFVITLMPHEDHGMYNHWQLYCLFNFLSRPITKNTPKLHINEGNHFDKLSLQYLWPFKNVDMSY